MDEEQDYRQDQGGNRKRSSANDQGGGGGRGSGADGGGGKMKKTACVGDCIRKPKAPMIGVKDLSNPRFGTMLFAEVLGTFFLVFMGCGSVKAYGGQSAYIIGPDDMDASSGKKATSSSTAPPDSNATTVEDADTEPITGMTSTEMPAATKQITFAAGQQAVMIAFAFGITVACIAQAIGHVSGAHLNPAVSFGLVVSGQCSLLQAICYTFAQILGAIIASGLLSLTTQTSYNALTGKPGETYDSTWDLADSLPSVPPLDAFLIEIFLTFLLVLVVCGVCDNLRQDIKGSAPLAIGLTVFVCHVTGMQYSGSSINPARSIGPVVYSAKHQDAAFTHIWIYIFGPLIGGMEAGLTYHVFFREKDVASERRSVAPA